MNRSFRGILELSKNEVKVFVLVVGIQKNNLDVEIGKKVGFVFSNYFNSIINYFFDQDQLTVIHIKGSESGGKDLINKK